MDAGIMNRSSHLKAQDRYPLHTQYLPRRNSKENLDRFIPNRAAMDFNYAHYMLTEGRKEKEKSTTTVASRSASKEAYKKQLAVLFNMNRSRILAFKNKPSLPSPAPLLPSDHIKRSFRHIPKTSERKLDAPGFEKDFYLSLLDWGSGNRLAIALGDTVHLWDASDRSVNELVTADDEEGPVTSVNWSPDGRHIAVGLNNCEVQLWDSAVNRKIRTLSGIHTSAVGSLAWNNNILTTGGMDGQITNNKVRIRWPAIEICRGHDNEVCGLKWSECGRKLASGGRDNLVNIWDRSMASSNASTQYLHNLEDHTSAIKAIAWCPFQGNLLATGGGEGDGSIKFWNTGTGACLNSVDTGSEVSGLIWSKKERELLSSHGCAKNELKLWKYPSMTTLAELSGHASRVVHMTQSPDGCTVASAGENEQLIFWNIFGDPEAAKKKMKKDAPKSSVDPISQWNRIR